MLQFHPEIVSRVDQGLEIECTHHEFVPPRLTSELQNRVCLSLSALTTMMMMI